MNEIQIAPGTCGTVTARSSVPLFPLIASVLEGTQRGRVFAAEADSDLVCGGLVVTSFGFVQQVGATDLAVQDLAEVLGSDPAIGQRYLLWYDPPEATLAWLQASGGEQVRTRVRLRLALLPGSEPCEAALQADGCSILPFRPDMVAELEALGVGVAKFWPSWDLFLQRGIGHCAVAPDGRILSACYSAAIARNEAEIDVLTHPDARGRGLASACVKAFISASLRQGIEPRWDCFDYNEASLALARACGFQARMAYGFLSFNTPLVCERPATNSGKESV